MGSLSVFLTQRTHFTKLKVCQFIIKHAYGNNLMMKIKIAMQLQAYFHWSRWPSPMKVTFISVVLRLFILHVLRKIKLPLILNIIVISMMKRPYN